MTDDEDSDTAEGKVLGPMLDFSRYYPTTLPMHQPQHDGSEACAMSDEVCARYHLSRMPMIMPPCSNAVFPRLSDLWHWYRDCSGCVSCSQGLRRLTDILQLQGAGMLFCCWYRCVAAVSLRCLQAQGSESMAEKLCLLEGGAGETLSLVQVPDLLPSAAPPPAPDPAAQRPRAGRREEGPPAAAAQGLKALPSGKVTCAAARCTLAKHAIP